MTNNKKTDLFQFPVALPSGCVPRLIRRFVSFALNVNRDNLLLSYDTHTHRMQSVQPSETSLTSKSESKAIENGNIFIFIQRIKYFKVTENYYEKDRAIYTL